MPSEPEVCGHCGRSIGTGAPHLVVKGTVDWVIREEHPGAGQILDGAALFCSIRCLGTFIGVTLEKRGLVPPKQRQAHEGT